MYKIREYREAKGLTQEELGKLVGVDQSTVASWEMGRINPSLTAAVRLADVLTGGSIDLLLGRTTA